MESLSVKRVEVENTQNASYTQQLETDLSDRQNRLTEIEEMFNNEKREKHNLIEEIMNLQEQLRTHEQEKAVRDGDNDQFKELLAREQEERDKLGEMARDRIQALEQEVRHLKDEVERWKKEVDMHVEAEAKFIGSEHEGREQQQQQQQQQTREQQQQTSPGM